MAFSIPETLVTGDLVTAGQHNKNMEAVSSFFNNESFIIYAQNHTPATNSTTTGEEELGNIIVSANQVTNGIFVIASGFTKDDGDSNRYVTVRLRAGSNPTYSSNSAYDTSVRRCTGAAAGFTIFRYFDSLDWTTANRISISGQPDTATDPLEATFEHMVIFRT